MYCPKCGKKLADNMNFCSKCGNKIKKETKKDEIKVKKKDKMTVEKKENILLVVGTILVIIASIIFAFATWNEMTDIFKLLFLTIESLLFIALSVFSKKVNNKMPYKFLWFIGISFIPIMLYLIGENRMIGDYLSYNGDGANIYLAISSSICAVLYFLSYKFLNSSFFEYISYIIAYFTVISILHIFKLDDIHNYNLIFPILNIFNFVLCIIYIKMKNELEKKHLGNFLSIFFIFFALLNCVYASNTNEILFVSISFIFNITTCLMLLFKSEKKILYIYPVLCYFVLNFGIANAFGNYVNVMTFASLLGIVLINLIAHQKNNKSVSIISHIFMILNTIFIFTNPIDYKTRFICFVLLLITYLFILKISDIKFNIVVCKVLLPITIYYALGSLIRCFTAMPVALICLMGSVILFTIYTIFNHNKKDNLSKIIFQVSAYVLLILGALWILIENINISAFIFSEVLWIYYYIYNLVVNKEKNMSIWLLIMLIMNFALCSIKYALPIYYSLLFASLITLIIDYINIQVYKIKSNYIYVSVPCCALASLRGFINISLFGICSNIIVYALSYYVLVKKHNVNIIIKFIYTLIGFILINSLFTRFIDNIVISNILILITYLIILISMFLLRVNKDYITFGYSILLVAPYVNIVENVPIFNQNSIAFYTGIAVILVLIYFERVFKLKETEKTIFELILLILIHIVTIFSLLIFNFIVAAFYIFYGLFKSREDISILGIVILILNIIFNIINIANNITITYVLLFIGVLMLTYVFYIEAKKNNKK